MKPKLEKKSRGRPPSADGPKGVFTFKASTTLKSLIAEAINRLATMGVRTNKCELSRVAVEHVTKNVDKYVHLFPGAKP